MKIVQLILLSIFLFAFSCKEENKNELENQLETAIESSGGKTADDAGRNRQPERRLGF